MANFKACISAYCKACIYDNAEPGSWREQTENCKVTQCELWTVRPMTTATIAANRKPRSKEGIQIVHQV